MRRGRHLPRRLLIDTAAFVALAYGKDSNNVAARLIQDTMVADGWRPFTTNFILAETHAFLLHRVTNRLALRIIQEISGGATTVERVIEDDEQRAIEILLHYDDKDFSYTDATSFAVMERIQIDTAFTFDRHFTQYGFRTLTADPT